MNSNNEIIVTYKNEKIDDGSYNLQIIKKSESSNWNEASNDTSEAVSNATYAIKQYLNMQMFYILFLYYYFYMFYFLVRLLMVQELG